MFVLVDHEERENEGDIVVPAQMATPEVINFMAKYGRGLICLTLTNERVASLGLELMSTYNSSRHETAFTISIEAREGKNERSFDFRINICRLWLMNGFKWLINM